MVSGNKEAGTLTGRKSYGPGKEFKGVDAAGIKDGAKFKEPSFSGNTVQNAKQEGPCNGNDVMGGCRRPSNEEREAMKELSLIPSAVVNSGRGTHLYFALNKPIDPEKAQELNESLAYVLRGDAGAGHCSHTLRFPGSWNYKYIPKKYVSVKVLGHIYDPEFFGFLPVAKKREVGKSSRYTAPVSLKSLQEKSNRCPIIEAAFSRPESLSYYAWFSLACVTDEETFVEISRRDANRFKENETRQMHRYLKERRYSPYNCDKLDEARNCPKKGRCFLKRIIHE